MKLRSGFEYTFASLNANSARASRRNKRSVMWHRFVKRHLGIVAGSFGPRSFANEASSLSPSSMQELTRLMTNSKSYSKAYWTKKWATQALARRFVSPSGESPHKSQDIPGPAPFQEATVFDVSFRSVPVSFAWKNKLNIREASLASQGLSTELLVMKRELFGKRGEIPPSWVPAGYEFTIEEWEMVYRTPSNSLDARFALSKPKFCSVPCYCRLHLGSSKLDAECITCENYSNAIKLGGPSQLWSTFFSRFKEHVSECKSTRARRYRRRYGSPYQMDEVCFEDTFFY